jgi:hypothetical protein
MKKLTKTAIAVAITLTLGLSTINATHAAEKVAQVHLASGTDTQFETYMNKKAKRFIKRNNEDWNTFTKIVGLYNNATGSFWNLSDSEKIEFLNTSESIKEKLSKMNDSEANLWLTKVNVTEKVFLFVWDNKLQKKPTESLYKLPEMLIENTVGR